MSRLLQKVLRKRLYELSFIEEKVHREEQIREEI